ncbi:MAG: S8/S53 family peptidase [Alphaproteobacteria bacterium]|nr:S8/S53 family peptidase [Alphaproteobacteria bacterium]
MPDAAAPSFLAIAVPDPASLGRIEADLAPFKGGEAGPALTRLDDARYVVARSVYKRLRLAQGLGGAVQVLRAIPGVARVDPLEADAVVRAMRDGLAREPAAPSAAPAAPSSWNLDAVRAPAAWDLFPGGRAGMAWRGTRIAQLDTGYAPIPCFGPWSPQGQSDSMLADIGINVFDPGGGRPLDPLDPSGTPGHGTRIGSVIAGFEDGRFSGVAPRAAIVPYRVTNFVVIDTLWNRNRLDLALDHAVTHGACSVVNVSLGDPCNPPRALGQAIDRAYQQGIIICAAAGNVTSEVTYPGRHARTVAAGGITPEDRPWTGGSRGPRVDICAPAQSVNRVRVFKDAAPGGYRWDVSQDEGDGTSYACAHLSAAAALWVAFHGSAIEARYGRTWRRVEAFRAALRASARVPSGWSRADFGAGILDIASLLQAPLPDPLALHFVADVAEDDV